MSARDTHVEGAVDVVLAAGGTGGHIFPAQALAAELQRRGRRIVLMTDQRGAGYESAFAGVPVIRVRAGTFARAGRLGQARVMADIALGTLQARRHLKRLRPGLVIGFGGYPSLPVMAAAISLGLRTCVHEQNAILGRVNRLLAGRVDAIAAAFPLASSRDAKFAEKLIVTGNPVRDAILDAAETPYAAPDETGPFNLLVTGGSQGATIMGEIVPPALAALPPAFRARLRVTQQVRAEDIERVAAHYAANGIEAECAPFINDVPRRLAFAHLVIARSGASTVAELAVVGRPSILVPLPTAMDDHQTANAKALADAGGAWLVPQSEFSPAEIAKRLQRLATVPARLADAAAAAKSFGRPQAARWLADLVESMAGMQTAGRSAGRRPRNAGPDMTPTTSHGPMAPVRGEEAA
jgi:UDP-N-acetylglucosamine--N-acetylmuramyl-(pentapeptide) pyrophosphoryl-undecaprenol N-acetylglucosamine transferase